MAPIHRQDTTFVALSPESATSPVVAPVAISANTGFSPRYSTGGINDSNMIRANRSRIGHEQNMVS
ncbi:hypothetical protein BG006_005383, partial [Podila minutissima]